MRDLAAIRPAGSGDLEAISHLEARLYPNPWFPATFRSLLKRGRARILVADHQEAGVVGYAVFWWAFEQAELANLAVDRPFQDKGIGGMLLDHALAEIGSREVEKVFLEVRESNRPALRLYRSRGFSQISVRKNYYRDPREDALVLVKSLDDQPETEEPKGGDGPGPG